MRALRSSVAEHLEFVNAWMCSVGLFLFGFSHPKQLTSCRFFLRITSCLSPKGPSPGHTLDEICDKTHSRTHPLTLEARMITKEGEVNWYDYIDNKTEHLMGSLAELDEVAASDLLVQRTIEPGDINRVIKPTRDLFNLLEKGDDKSFFIEIDRIVSGFSTISNMHYMFSPVAYYAPVLLMSKVSLLGEKQFLMTICSLSIQLLEYYWAFPGDRRRRQLSLDRLEHQTTLDVQMKGKVYYDPVNTGFMGISIGRKALELFKANDCSLGELSILRDCMCSLFEHGLGIRDEYIAKNSIFSTEDDMMRKMPDIFSFA